jgi:hypothetical protein
MTQNYYEWSERYLNSRASDDIIDDLNIDESIAPVWTGAHTFSDATFDSATVSSELTVPVYSDTSSLPDADKGSVAFVESEGTLYVQVD